MSTNEELIKNVFRSHVAWLNAQVSSGAMSDEEYEAEMRELNEWMKNPDGSQED